MKIFALYVTLLAATSRVWAGGYFNSCNLPAGADQYAVITHGDAEIGAHHMDKGLAIGGVLSDPSPTTRSIVDHTHSFVYEVANNTNIQFNDGISTNSSSVTDGMYDQFVYIAQHAQNSSSADHKVIVLTQGGTFNTYDFNEGGQGQDNGKTLVIFNTAEDITLSRTNDGQQFGPSIIAPFSEVSVRGDAGFVDGFIMSKTFITTGECWTLKLHGDTFTGSIECSSPTTAPTTKTTTVSPTNAPTGSPSSSPTTAPSRNYNPNLGNFVATPSKAGGDPHFTTWLGHKFDYHGECDLVLVENPSFAGGLGLRVHIRTKRIKYYSYIETIALQIGSDVLEFNNDVDNYLINGKKAEESGNIVAGFEVRRFGKNALSVRLDEKTKAHIDFYHRKNGFPFVKFDGKGTSLFEGSLGLLGDWSTGSMIGRDRSTEIKDAEEYALEWQVRDTEPMLFSSARYPQFPTVCTAPEKLLGKRLGDSHMKEAAEKACAAWDEDKDDCIFDVMATRDILSAEALVVHSDTDMEKGKNAPEPVPDNLLGKIKASFQTTFKGADADPLVE